MNNRYIKMSLAMTVVSSLVVSNVTFADESLWDKTTRKADQAGKVIGDTAKKTGDVIVESSEKVATATVKTVEKVDKYVDDSTLTAKVKKVIADDSLSAGYDISVTTRHSVVTLTGFVTSVELQIRAVKLAASVDGVKSVSDKLNVKTDKSLTVKDFARDARITSAVKAKLLAAEGIPLTGIGVETVDGIVQLSGSVKTLQQAEDAERIAKQVNDVLSVKNDLAIRP